MTTLDFCFDTFINYSFPSICSSIIDAIDSLGQEQNPPYSHGSYFVEIRTRFNEQSWSHKVFYEHLIDSIFALMARHNHLYIDANFATFSTRRINDSFRTYDENL